MKAVHTIDHAVHGCTCAARDITGCVICGRALVRVAGCELIDVCGMVCFRKLLAKQRAAALDDDRSNVEADLEGREGNPSEFG